MATTTTTTTPSSDQDSSSSSFDEGELTCAVCLDLYNEPTVLKCKHSFCKECVAILTKPANLVSCPLCREETKLEEIVPNTQLIIKVKNMKKVFDIPKPCINKDKARKIVIPRNIKLLEEYDNAIGKGTRTYIPVIHTGFIGYGLDEEKENNHDMRFWRAMIIGPQESPIGQVIYNLSISVPDGYPKEPPEVRFVNPTIMMGCVNGRGVVDISKIEKVDMSTVEESTGQTSEGLGEFFVWSDNCNIADVLVGIRENMHLESVSNESGDLSNTNYASRQNVDDSSNSENENGNNTATASSSET